MLQCATALECMFSPGRVAKALASCARHRGGSLAVTVSRSRGNSPRSGRKVAQEAHVSVRAKLYVASITQYPGSTQVNLQAVTRGKQNAEWASATPAAQMSITIRNDLASAQFELGKEYYLTFEPAEAAPSPNDKHELQPMQAYSSGAQEVCNTCGLYSDVNDANDPWHAHRQLYGTPVITE